jgi:DNA-binding MltR family transcriptional regulator
MRLAPLNHRPLTFMTEKTKEKLAASSQHRERAWNLFNDEFEKESERAKVILSAAMLDEALEALLRAFLVPSADSNDQVFDGPNAPLGTFSARVDFCFRLGLISKKLTRDLHLIRKIRNEFAHNVTGCNFNVSAVANRVTLLRQSFGLLIKQHEEEKGGVLTTIQVFQEIVGWMIFHLWGEVSRASSLNEAKEEWGYNQRYLDDPPHGAKPAQSPASSKKSN